MTSKAEKAYQRIREVIVREARPLSRADYIEVMDEIASLCEGNAEASREEQKREEGE